MGVTVRQKIKGKGQPWWVFITHNGKRRSRKIGPKATAKRIAAEIQEKIARQEFNLEREKPVPTFGEYSEKWLKDYVSVSCRESTYEEYNGILKNHVLPVFEDKPIDQVRRGDIRDFLLSKIKQDFSKSRIGLFKDVLSGVLGYALDEELIQANPTLGITKRLFPKSDERYKKLKSKYVQEFEKYYAILGCGKNDNNEHIKSRYRKLVMEYHPDKIVSKGLPEEFTKFAQDKFREIQEAYDYIRKERGIK